MKQAVSVLTQVVGVATLLGLGYVFMSALPDLKRYIRISTM
jgi:hypothetical protein